MLEVDRREQEPRPGESSRQFMRPQEGEYIARQPRRWEANGKHKSRGSLLFRREGDDVIPRRTRVHEVKTTPKPRIQKVKKSLRINPGINIPSTVSVGNFARLLNVSLGMGSDHLIGESTDNLYSRSLATGDGKCWNGGAIIL